MIIIYIKNVMKLVIHVVLMEIQIIIIVIFVNLIISSATSVAQ